MLTVGASQGECRKIWKYYPAKEIMWKIGNRVNSWAESHEEKCQHVPKQLKDKIQENQRTLKKCLHRPMIMDGGEGKKLKKDCVVENIEQQKNLEKVMKSEIMRKYLTYV